MFARCLDHAVYIYRIVMRYEKRNGVADTEIANLQNIRIFRTSEL